MSIKLYRLCRERYATDLTGEGAKLYGGRWNSAGLPMLYTATHRSLAVLESLVHLPKKLIPKDMVLITLEIAREELDLLDTLPHNWQEMPVPRSTQKIGDLWLEKNEMALKVPSTVIPEEYNVILNPSSVDFTRFVKLLDYQPFSFDRRLVQ